MELRGRFHQHQARVMSPNSLMGSVSVQGPALALLLAQRFPGILVTEAHPKVTTCALNIPLAPAATRANRVLDALSIVGTSYQLSDDLVDAVVAAYVAWSAHTERPGWVDLVAQFEDPGLIYPLGKERSMYYFPWQTKVP